MSCIPFDFDFFSFDLSAIILVSSYLPFFSSSSSLFLFFSSLPYLSLLFVFLARLAMCLGLAWAWAQSNHAGAGEKEYEIEEEVEKVDKGRLCKRVAKKKNKKMLTDGSESRL